MITAIEQDNSAFAGQPFLIVYSRTVKNKVGLDVTVKLGVLYPAGRSFKRGSSNTAQVVTAPTEQELRDWAAANGVEVR